MTTMLWDVVVIEDATRVVDHVAGSRMNDRQADRRENTVWPRLNDRYSVVRVEAGRFKKGDVVR